MLKRIPMWGRPKQKLGPSRDDAASRQVQLLGDFELIPNDRGPLGPPSPLRNFALWLIECGNLEGLDRRTLWVLYGEFCFFSHTEMLTNGQLFRRLRGTGIERYRETVGARRRLYRVRAASLIHLKHPRRAL